MSSDDLLFPPRRQIKWLLDGRTPYPVDNVLRWSEGCEARSQAIDHGQPDPWKVAHTIVGDVTVSTVFLGTDHSFGSGPPVLFETMIFADDNDDFDDWQERDVTWDAAQATHDQAVAMVNDRLHAR